MFDRIILKAKLNADESVKIAHTHRLQRVINEDGEIVEYRSSSYANITGISVRIARGEMTLKTSLHSYYNKRMYDVMRNDNSFTIDEALLAFDMLLDENNLNKSRTRITQFEIGLNLELEHDPSEYIKRCLYICVPDKEMFVDAHYRLDRQRTTMKHKDMRKYFKIYDKSFEMVDRRKVKADRSQINKLRIETVYKRHSEKLSTFATPDNFKRIAMRFRSDWQGLVFERNVQAEMGTRKSELDRAKEILRMGVNQYVERMRQKHEDGELSYKQFRTCRDFARDFEQNRNSFKTVKSTYEIEYQEKLKEKAWHDLA